MSREPDWVDWLGWLADAALLALLAMIGAAAWLLAYLVGADSPWHTALFLSLGAMALHATWSEGRYWWRDRPR